MEGLSYLLTNAEMWARHNDKTQAYNTQEDLFNVIPLGRNLPNN